MKKKIKKKWKEILKKESIDESKTFIGNGGWEVQCSKLMAWIHKTFRVNVKHEEMMESTIDEQVEIIKSKETPKDENLKCIRLKDKKTIVTKPSFQQEEVLKNEYFFLMGYK